MKPAVENTISMRTGKYFLACIITLTFTACTIEDPPKGPQMQVQPLFDDQVMFTESQAVDLDLDGTNDLVFGMEPMDDSSPGFGFALRSRENLEVYADKGNAIPALEMGTFIRENPQDPWHWDAQASMLCSFSFGTLNGESAEWQGHWVDVSNRYLGIRLRRGDLWYPGWIRMSVDTSLYTLILHEAAISVEPSDLIEAGSY